MSDFVVRIDSTKLSAKQAAQVASAIQGVVLSEMGKLDLASADAAKVVPTGALLFHPEWRGMWLRSLKDMQNPVASPVLHVVEKPGQL